jgi:hypothetical protein
MPVFYIRNFYLRKNSTLFLIIYPYHDQVNFRVPIGKYILEAQLIKLEVKREFSDKDSGECYQAGLRMVKKAGYKIFKTREFAALIMCKGLIDGHNVELSVSVPFGYPPSVIMILASNMEDDNLLRSEADRLLALLEGEL